MKPGNRLLSIASMLNKCPVFADIGTDHCLLPIYMALNNFCEKVKATDNKSEPLKKALMNVTKYHLNDRITLIEGYGLDPIEENETYPIVISGMGGKLIRDILNNGYEKAKKVPQLIIQPMNSPELVREWLYNNGFEILNEVLVKESGKIYIIINTFWTGKSFQYDEDEDEDEADHEFCCYFSKPLLLNTNPLMLEYLTKKRMEINEIIAGKQKAKRDTSVSQSMLLNMLNKLDRIILQKVNEKGDG